MEFVKKNIKVAIASLAAIVFFDYIKPVFSALFSYIYEYLWNKPALDFFDTHGTTRNYFSSIFSTVLNYLTSIVVACGAFWVINAIAERHKKQANEKEVSPRTPESPSEQDRSLGRVKDLAPRGSPRAALVAPIPNNVLARGLPPRASPRPPSPIPGSKGNSPRIVEQPEGIQATSAGGLPPPSIVMPKGTQLDAITGRRRSPSVEASFLGRAGELKVAGQRAARATSMGGAYESPTRPDPSSSQSPFVSSGEVRLSIRSANSQPSQSPFASSGDLRSSFRSTSARPDNVPPLLLATPPPPLSPRGTTAVNAANMVLPPPPPITPRPK
jgi:hypothetical protein